MDNYHSFLESKRHHADMHGFSPTFMPDCLMDFQAHLVDWATQKGRAAIFADCGLGKTLMQLVWAQNVVQQTNGRVLILAPLAVSAQTVREGEKFGIKVNRDREGELDGKILITNYERLSYFDPSDFVGCVCDESSILKNYSGSYRQEITEFMRNLSYRLLCTATAAPNDYTELGTSSEALGELGYMDMLGRFFKNASNPTVEVKRRYHGDVPKWRFKWHAEEPFWKWVCTWARALRKPSDLGFDDNGFNLPPLKEQDHVVKASEPMPGMLLTIPARNLHEQRKERRHTLEERCEKAAELTDGHDTSIVWCRLNDEADLCEKLIPGAVQVSGSQDEKIKEEKLMAFLHGESPVLVTKPLCAGFGLNMQHCAHMTFFPSHSYEQYYQSVRRCWRFGQDREVTVDVVTSEGEAQVMSNLKRKARAADKMFDKLVQFMNDAQSIEHSTKHTQKTEVASWL